MMPKGVDYLKPGSPQAERRNAIHRHNGFIGCARMMRVQARTIINASTTTSNSKLLAIKIETLADMLGESLRTRSDQKKG